MTSALLPAAANHPPHEPALLGQYRHVRAATEAMVADISDADSTVQSMDDASPAKWHLAHTTWFFEEFVLAARIPDYEPVDPQYRYLFNSYYEAVGARHPRPRRGLLTRPSLDEILAYREAVDESMLSLLTDAQTDAEAALVTLGLNHEQQHQELLLTDILHLFAQNPLRPAYAPALTAPVIADPRPAPEWLKFSGGVVAIGHAGDDFAFDCETPRHNVLLQPYALSSHPVSNHQWFEFIEDGGYQTAGLWLSDGWRWVCDNAIQAPLYWEERDGTWWQMTLRGMQPVDADSPGHARELLRGRRLRALGRAPAADRGRMGARGAQPIGDRQFRGRPHAAAAAGSAEHLGSACARCSAMSGNGPPAPSCPIPASARARAR